MTSVSKNMYIVKLDDIVDEYNNTYHRTIKMKPVDVAIIHILILTKKLVIKIQNLKLVIMLNTKIFLPKDTCEIGLKKILLLVKLKIQFHGYMLLTILMVKKLLEHYMKKNYKRPIKKNLE